MEKNNNAEKRYNIYIIIMEYAWLTIAISSLVTAIIDFYYHGWNNECLKFGILTLLSFGMYCFRRYKRKKDANK
ncbi:MAG: hypothetical protein J5588_06585 [Bacteroidales bacterium]|nr:hypothetical protein [Bacteroidales bacterium]MBO7055457.1 hypothetical protein [Bacteroidales bacterium]